MLVSIKDLYIPVCLPRFSSASNSPSFPKSTEIVCDSPRTDVYLAPLSAEIQMAMQRHALRVASTAC